MADYDPIKITLGKEAAIEAIQRVTGSEIGTFTVVKDGLTFETSEHGSVHVHMNLYAIISANDMADIIISSGLLADRAKGLEHG